MDSRASRREFTYRSVVFWQSFLITAQPRGLKMPSYELIWTFLTTNHWPVSSPGFQRSRLCSTLIPAACTRKKRSTNIPSRVGSIKFLRHSYRPHTDTNGLLNRILKTRFSRKEQNEIGSHLRESFK